ncbi:MAG: Fur family transcriptional regulator [Rickettsiales bacterium]|jgi:Fur family zinc uptake transcriptional regulator|nr:Fur family transcriptional regulator [Rickettsiales bacterium]
MDSIFPKPNHDHSECVDEAIAMAVKVCREKSARFTYLRKRVLELIWASHKPVGAYDILDMMNDSADARVAPMTVYRAIDFLMENGLVHRIASRNAYVGCRHPGAIHEGQFLLCRDCGRFAEIEELAISKALLSGAKRAGFDALSPLIEIEGRCQDCREPLRE